MNKAAQIIVDFRDFPLGCASSICLGNFDGVHIGHQQILKTCLDSAKRNHLVSVAFTFFPHPSRVLSQGRSLKLILTQSERRELLERAGVDWILEQKFTVDFSKWPAEEFAEAILYRTLNAKSVTVGSNFRFGQGARGTPELLKAQTFFDTNIISSVQESASIVSSSNIRSLIESGQIEIAAKSLGYPYFITGRIVTGKSQGRKLGFATANLDTEKECLPAKGVYLTMSQDLDTQHFYPSLTNVGVRPTVEESQRISIESHLIYFEGDLYHRPMRVFFLSKLREEIRFENIEALRHQIGLDLQLGKTVFEKMKWLQTYEKAPMLGVKNPDSWSQRFQPFERIEKLAPH